MISARSELKPEDGAYAHRRSPRPPLTSSLFLKGYHVRLRTQISHYASDDKPHNRREDARRRRSDQAFKLQASRIYVTPFGFDGPVEPVCYPNGLFRLEHHKGRDSKRRLETGIVTVIRSDVKTWADSDRFSFLLFEGCH